MSAVDWDVERKWLVLKQQQQSNGDGESWDNLLASFDEAHRWFEKDLLPSDRQNVKEILLVGSTGKKFRIAVNEDGGTQSVYFNAAPSNTSQQQSPTTKPMKKVENYIDEEPTWWLPTTITRRKGKRSQGYYYDVSFVLIGFAVAFGVSYAFFRGGAVAKK